MDEFGKIKVYEAKNPFNLPLVLKGVKFPRFEIGECVINDHAIAKIKITEEKNMDGESGPYAYNVDTHHDGHGLNEITRICAGPRGPGGAPDFYDVFTEGNKPIRIQFQAGPRNEEGSTPGILDSALLAIVLDRMQGYNSGKFQCRENAIIATKIEEAMLWMKKRADDRAKRGVLGKSAK